MVNINNSFAKDPTFLKQNASAEAGLVAVLEQNAEMAAAAAKAPPAGGMGARLDVSV